MTTDTAELERQLQTEKQQLRTSLETIGNRASEAVDWRHHVRTHPVETLGIAAVVGVVVGALTSRPTARGRAFHAVESVGDSMGRPLRPSGPPEWQRLKAGVMGMLADRALVMAQDFVERATKRPST